MVVERDKMTMVLGYSGLEKRKITYHLRDEFEVILDVGCGSGLYDDIFKDKFIVGVDIDKSALIKANNKNKYAYYVLGDAENLPLKSQKFDFVLIRELLEHLNNPKNLLDEVNRVMKKHALMYFSTPSKEIKNSLYVRYVGLKKFNKQRGHVRDGFTLTELKNLLKESNLKEIEIQYGLKFINRFLWDLCESFNVLRFPLAILWLFGEKFDEKINCKGMKIWGFVKKDSYKKYGMSIIEKSCKIVAGGIINEKL